MLNENRMSPPYLPCEPTGVKGKSSYRSLEVMDVSHKLRVYAEAFVQEIFFKAYQARLNSFYPVLLSITRQDGDFAAVAGIRPAGGGPLFTEHYLDRPIEQILCEDRERIVEIGNLAPASAGQARWLIVILSAFMSGAGFNHVVFTAVPRLFNAFRRMGLPLSRLADARKDSLPAEVSADWGTYYESRPAVFSGDIRVGQPALQRVARLDPELELLYRSAHDAGRAFVRHDNAEAV